MGRVEAACYAARRRESGIMEVLLTKRPYWNEVKDKPKQFPGEWVFPGGKLELDEEPLEAAIRELREELGYAGDFHDSVVLISTRTIPGISPRHMYTVQYFTGRLDPDPLFVPAVAEVSAYRWMSPRDACDLIRSPEFLAEQREAFFEQRLGDIERRMPIGTLRALEALIRLE